MISSHLPTEVMKSPRRPHLSPQEVLVNGYPQRMTAARSFGESEESGVVALGSEVHLLDMAVCVAIIRFFLVGLVLVGLVGLVGRFEAWVGRATEAS